MAAMAELRASHVVAQDVTGIRHVFKYINVGLHGKPDRFSTICLVKKILKKKCLVKKMQEPDTPQRIIFASFDVTPEHGDLTIEGVNDELILRFNARFGKSGFEDTDL